MLSSLDLSQKLTKEKYKEYIAPLKETLRDLQREILEAQRPVLILFEGLEASGKGDSIRLVVEPLDPRGFKVELTPMEPAPEEQLRPPLRRFWLRIPGKGEIGIFDRSWYMPALAGRVEGTVKDKAWNERKEEIKQFERQLVDDGTLLIKFWLQVSKKEQKKRFQKIEKSKYEGWRISKADWRAHKRYGRYNAIADELLGETDTPYAPWTLVPADDPYFRRIHVLRTITETLKRRMREPRVSNHAIISQPTSSEVHPPETVSLLDRVDLRLTLSREEYEGEKEKYQKRLRELEFACYEHRIPVVIVYMGWDAAGKGGNIKRITQELDPRGYTVIPISAPKGDEATHHYLWRFWKQLPKAGHFAIFDRSWYERVLVERIEGFCTEEEWKRAYYEINEFERHLAHFGTVMVKFWIHISKDEQWRRFEERKNTPHKQYKLTEEDYRNREKWDLYATAVNEMIERTSTNYAPWTILEGNCKLWARVKALRTLTGAIESRIAREGAPGR
ncbi:MAG: polyphosphate:AMP phosphotransferase [bacterium]